MIFYSQYDHRTYLNESNAMQIVNEAYFGKTKEVLAIEQAVHDLRAPYIKDYDHTLNMDTYTPRINRDPNKQKLQEAICDAFGFSDALFQITSSTEALFGTESTSFCVDLNSKKMNTALRATSKGFRYDKSANILFVMTCSTGVLTDSELTDAEITAGILHEIGHNFSPAVSRGVYAVSMFPAITWVSIFVQRISDKMINEIEFNSIDELVGLCMGILAQSNYGHLS